MIATTKFGDKTSIFLSIQPKIHLMQELMQEIPIVASTIRVTNHECDERSKGGRKCENTQNV